MWNLWTLSRQRVKPLATPLLLVSLLKHLLMVSQYRGDVLVYVGDLNDMGWSLGTGDLEGGGSVTIQPCQTDLSGLLDNGRLQIFLQLCSSIVINSSL